MDGLARGEVDAVVSAEMLVKYLAATKYPTQIQVLPGTCQNAGTGFALKKESPYRKAINLALLTIVEGDGWAQNVAKHLSLAPENVSH